MELPDRVAYVQLSVVDTWARTRFDRYEKKQKKKKLQRGYLIIRYAHMHTVCVKRERQSEKESKIYPLTTACDGRRTNAAFFFLRDYTSSWNVPILCVHCIRSLYVRE